MKIKICILLSILLVPLATNAMWQQAQKVAQAATQSARTRAQQATQKMTFEHAKTWAKNKVQTPRHAFNTACKGIGFGLTFGPIWYECAKKEIESRKNITFIKEENDLFEAPPLIKDFVDTQFKAVGVDSSNVTIRMNPTMQEGNAVYTDGNIVGIRMLSIKDEDSIMFHSELYNLLDKKQDLETKEKTVQIKKELEVIEQKLDYYRFILQHEAIHAKHQDPTNKKYVAILSPLITHVGLKKLKQIASIGKCVTSATPTIKKSLLEPVAGWGKWQTSLGIQTMHSRYIEQRADDGVSDNISVLKAAGLSFMEEHEHIVNELKKTGQEPSWLHFVSIDPEHPMPFTRAMKFIERINKLKEQAVERKS